MLVNAALNDCLQLNKLYASDFNCADMRKIRKSVGILRFPRGLRPQPHQPKIPSTLDLRDTPRKCPENQVTVVNDGQ